VTAEQAVVLALLVLAFAAGWIARGPVERRRAGGGAPDGPGESPVAVPATTTEPAMPAAPAAPAAVPVPVARSASPAGRPDPGASTLRALDQATSALETAIDRWLDEGPAITPAGRAAVGEVDRAVGRLDTAVARLRDADPDGAERVLDAEDALDAVREAAGLLDAFRSGAALDGATSRRLDRLQDEAERARAVLAQGAPDPGH
jgi:hypothetical protein